MAGAGARVAIIGGGWAGIASAIEATRRGHAVALFEMAPHLGGRARGVHTAGERLDNGQHILIGAYVRTLDLMRTVGVDIDQAFVRTPLRLVGPDGRGLRLTGGAPIAAFARAVLDHAGWRWRDRVALLSAATGWAVRGFRCDPSIDVATFTASLPRAIRAELIDPLCVAALNTPSNEASAQVFLRVLKDALFSGTGSADLLLPRSTLDALLPDPAGRWLRNAGAELRLSHRVESLARRDGGWAVDGEAFDRVVLASTSNEAARLTRPIAPDWSAGLDALRFEPIVTVYLRSEGTRLPEAMLSLPSDATAPAQFVFDRGQLGGSDGLLAFVASGAQAWVDRGMQATETATIAQAQKSLGALLRAPLQKVQTLIEKRATFRCTPALARPSMAIAPGLHAAGDYVAGPYPATLEGAVRSAIAAVEGFD